MDSVSKNTIQAYVELLDEAIDTWRPVQAEGVGNGIFRLLPTPNYDPEDEKWEFPPGSLVRLVKKELSDGSVLVAIAP